MLTDGEPSPVGKTPRGEYGNVYALGNEMNKNGHCRTVNEDAACE